MFRRRRKRPLPVISIRDDNPADDIVRLEPLLSELNTVIETLWMEVEGLRSELAHVRGTDGHETARTFESPPTHIPPDRTGDAHVDRRILSILVDDLNGSAETLWYESQWVRGQLSSVLEDMRGLTNRASTWRQRP
jgi:hypothetical protein